MDETTFLVSSFQETPRRFFQGYCFIGRDYIYGSKGAQAYEDATGNRIAGGHDGCYVSIEGSRTHIIVQTDYSGYKKVFYYHDGTHWAVSNSIVQIVRHLAHAGISLKANLSQLAAIVRGGPALSQLFSFETPVTGVSLLPLHRTLLVTPERALTIPVATPRGFQDYRTALESHLRLWTSRFETLINDTDIVFTSDITGGADSRVNLALILKAAQRLGTPPDKLPRMRCGVTGPDSRDYEIAKELCQHYNLPLNPDRKLPQSPLRGFESYRSWRDLCLGSYHPIYLPTTRPHSHNVTVGGGGAGIHRPFYERHIKTDDATRFIDVNARKVNPAFLRPYFTAAARNAMQQLGENVPAELLLIRHYREFRARLHAGRSPQYGVTFTPFSSAELDDAHHAAGSERLKLGQLNFDMMWSLAPELLEMRFDDPRKGPSSEARQLLTRVDVGNDASPGVCWTSEEAKPIPSVDGEPNAFNYLSEAFAEASRDEFVKDFIGSVRLSDATAILELAAETGRFPHASHAIPISAILMTYEISPTREFE